MNSVHDSKDWQNVSSQAALQSPTAVAVDPASSPKPSSQNNSYPSPTNTNGYHANSTSANYTQDTSL